MPKNATDPISPWFDICEELDEYIGIRFGRLAPGATDPEWMFVRHRDFDGIGGLAELLRRRGAVIPKIVADFWLQTTPKHPNRKPIVRLPESPRKIEAGLKLYRRNPSRAPTKGVTGPLTYFPSSAA